MGNGLSKARFLTVQEVADLMRVSSMTVYRLIKAGELPAVRVGRSFRVAEGDVDTYLASGYTRPDSQRRLPRAGRHPTLGFFARSGGDEVRFRAGVASHR